MEFHEANPFWFLRSFVLLMIPSGLPCVKVKNRVASILKKDDGYHRLGQPIQTANHEAYGPARIQMRLQLRRHRFNHWGNTRHYELLEYFIFHGG